MANNELLAKGDLNSDERAELNGIRTGLNEALSLKNYQTGDLSSSYTTLKISYDSSYRLSNERKEQTKRLAQEAARKKAEEEKAAQKQTQANTLLNNKTPAPIPNSGGWNQAPAGYKFLKVESGKTYGQVKNPDNFRLITEAEAAKYTPGHVNGSAKQ